MPAEQHHRAPFIVGVGGTTRTGSTTERCLLLVLSHAASLGCDTLAIGGAELPTEIFDAAQPARSPRAQALVSALKRADGIILATPSYHGGPSGLVKNALDYVEDLRADERIYFEHRAVGLVICAEGPQALGSTLASMRAIVHSLRGWPTPYAATINTLQRPFGEDGRTPDEAVLKACATVAEEVVGFARRQAKPTGR